MLPKFDFASQTIMQNRYHYLLFLLIIFLVYFMPNFVVYANSNAWIDGTYALIERAKRIEIIDDETAISFAPALKTPQAGDKKEFYAINFTRMPKAYFVPATCRAVGDFCYIFVEDSQWQKGKVTNVGVERIRNAFDKSTPANNIKGIYAIESENLGLPPDAIDNDPKIYILILDIPDNNADGSYIAGYFDPLNQKKGILRDPFNGVQFRSNEVEIIYLDCSPLDIGSLTARETLAHEFQHLIHWNSDPDEEAWINEGCSEYASRLLCGYGSLNDSAHIKAFEQNPQTSLIYWADNMEGSLASYGAAYLWMVYLHENYGGVSTISELIANQANSINSVDIVLASKGYSENFDDIFGDWKIANYLDNLDLGSGKFGYRGLDVGVKIGRRYSLLPALGTSQSIQSFTASYIEFNKGKSDSGINIKVESRKPSNKLNAKVISMAGGKPIAVDSIPIESGNGSIMVSAFGYDVDKVILVTSWTPRSEADFGNTSYYDYSANAGNEIGFSVTILPNAINNRYLDVIAKLLEKRDMQGIGIDVPRITILKNGKEILNKQAMVAFGSGSVNSVYTYQFYIADKQDDGDIFWEIHYLDHLVSSGSFKDRY